MKFSIITPAYNVAEYVPAMFESVLAQTCADWEQIVVDDGSSDDTGKICDAFAQRDARIHVIHQKNGGVSAARNEALEKATGAWIVFLDADDLLSPYCLESIGRVIDEHKDGDLVHFCFEEFDLQPPSFSRTMGSCVVVDLDSSLPISAILSSFGAYAYRRDLIEEVKFNPYCTGEDRLFLGVALSKARRMVDVSYAAYAYRQRPGSAMCSKMTLLKLRDRIGYSLDWLTVLSNCGKAIPASFYHLVVANLTEGYVSDIFELEEEARSEAWEMWYGCLSQLKRFTGRFSPWARFVINVTSLVRLHGVAMVLCWVPHRLKLKGLHR